jgi:hypothetical protein
MSFAAGRGGFCPCFYAGGFNAQVQHNRSMDKLQTLALSFRNNRFHDTVYFYLDDLEPCTNSVSQLRSIQ